MDILHVTVTHSSPRTDYPPIRYAAGRSALQTKLLKLRFVLYREYSSQREGNSTAYRNVI